MCCIHTTSKVTRSTSAHSMHDHIGFTDKVAPPCSAPTSPRAGVVASPPKGFSHTRHTKYMRLCPAYIFRQNMIWKLYDVYPKIRAINWIYRKAIYISRVCHAVSFIRCLHWHTHWATYYIFVLRSCWHCGGGGVILAGILGRIPVWSCVFANIVCVLWWQRPYGWRWAAEHKSYELMCQKIVILARGRWCISASLRDGLCHVSVIWRCSACVWLVPSWPPLSTESSPAKSSQLRVDETTLYLKFTFLVEAVSADAILGLTLAP